MRYLILVVPQMHKCTNAHTNRGVCYVQAVHVVQVVQSCASCAICAKQAEGCGELGAEV